MLTFILGGARSGKSELATHLASAAREPVLFVATMRELDDEMRERVAAHRAQRPGEWRTVEAPVDLVRAARGAAEPVIIVDCVTVWISNLLLDALPDPDAASGEAVAECVRDIDRQVRAFAEWASAYSGEVIVVSNDVGNSVVPPYRLGRIFRDCVGSANKTFAARAATAYYVIAGMAIDLRAAGALPIGAVASARR